MGRWGLNSALTTRLPSMVSSALSVSTQAIQLTPPPPLPNPGPRSPPWRAHRAPSSPVLPVRPSLPGRAAEAEALASRRLPGPGNARSSRPPHRLPSSRHGLVHMDTGRQRRLPSRENLIREACPGCCQGRRQGVTSGPGQDWMDLPPKQDAGAGSSRSSSCKAWGSAGSQAPLQP